MKMEVSNELKVKLRYHLVKALQLPLDSVTLSQGNFWFGLEFNQNFKTHQHFILVVTSSYLLKQMILNTENKRFQYVSGIFTLTTLNFWFKKKLCPEEGRTNLFGITVFFLLYLKI